MERLNWAVLGLIGIVTALGLTTSSSAEKSKANLGNSESNFQYTPGEILQVCSPIGGVHPNDIAIELAANLPVTSSGHACSACQAKKETSGQETETSDHETTDCPLTKVGEDLLNLTKNFVCEGGNCLTKQGHGTLTITAVDPAPAQPEGLSNLLAAAEAVKSSPPAGTITVDELPVGEITLSTEPILTTAEGLNAIEALTKNKTAANTKTPAMEKGETKAAEPKPDDRKLTVENSRAMVRSAKLAKLEAKMEMPWELEFDSAQLEHIAKLVQEKYGVPVIIDRKALDEAAFDLATPITMTKQPEIETGEYLKGALNDLGLTWIIPASSDRVLITTPTAMEAKQLINTYEVSDLLVDDEYGPEQLLDVIQNTISPANWKNNGGQGNLTVWKSDSGVKLVVSNNYWIQHELADFLADLRSGAANKSNAVKKTSEHKSSYWKRYTLLDLKEVKDAEQRQKLLAGRRQFLLAICRNIEGFDPENFEVANYDGDILVTKQTIAVHRLIEKQLGLVAPSVGAYQSQSPKFPD